MNKLVVVVLILIGLKTNNLNAQQPIDHSQILLKELRTFIDTVKPQTVFMGKFNVYVVKFNSEKNDCTCNPYVTMGYIQNDYNLDFTYFNYYFCVDSELVLTYVPDSTTFELLSGWKLIKVDRNNISVILKKVTDSRFRSITGTSKGQVCCIKNGELTKVFYRDSDEIPKQYSIFNVNKIMERVGVRELYPNTLKPLPKDK